jgi:O-antigen/teichoic acid export membrane protein
MGLTLVLSLLVPACFADRLGPNVHEAQWVVLFLGATMAVQISSSVFNGILTGCHRWDLHNINTSGWYAVTAAGMVAALLSGGGLRSLAAVTLVGEVLAAARRALLAYRVCEGLQLRYYLVRWRTLTRLFAFGGKTLIPTISDLLLNQTTSILIVAYLGPAALALYSRPRSLTLHVQTLVNKMAMTLTPTTSSLQGTADVKEITDLAVKSARYALYLSLPMVLMLAVFGGAIMRFWMGPRYAHGWLPAILAVGYLPVMVQLPTLSMLAGLNAHGRAGIARFVASLISVALGVLALKYLRWGLVGTALAITLPLAILNIVDIPHLLCRRVGLATRQYCRGVAAGPVLHTLPFAVCLVGARLIFPARPMVGLAWGSVVGGGILGLVYWRYVVPNRVKAGLSFFRVAIP